MTMTQHENMQAALAHDARRPRWTRRRNTESVWSEDDATPGTPGHETIRAAWERIYNENYSTIAWAEIHDDGDAYFRLTGDGRIAIESYPGNSEIRQLAKF